MDLDNILNPYDIQMSRKQLKYCFPGCNGALHTDICAPGEKQLTIANQRDCTIDQEEKPSLHES